MEGSALLITFAHRLAVGRGNVGESQRQSVPADRRPGPGRRHLIEITVLGIEVVEASRIHRLEIFLRK